VSEKKRGVDKHYSSDCKDPKLLGTGGCLPGLEQSLRFQGFVVVHTDVTWLQSFHARQHRRLLQGSEICRSVKLGAAVFMECRGQQRKAATLLK